MYFSLGQVSN